jgi:histidinol-phosphate aminotransferase
MSLTIPSVRASRLPRYSAGASTLPGFPNPIKLSSNESPLGPSPLAIRAFRDYGATLHRYPDGDGLSFRQALERRFGLPVSETILGSGSESLLDLIVRAYANSGDEVLFPRFSFPLYPILAQAAGATPVEAPAANFSTDVDALLAHVSDKTKIAIVANPNNPTGTWIARSELVRLRRGLPAGTLLIVDSAYAEFVTDSEYSAGHDLVSEGAGNVIVTRTMSKAYGLAALRVGWAHAHAEIIDVLRRLQMPFPVAAPAVAAAVAALEDVDHAQRVVEHNSIESAWFQGELLASGFEVLTPSGGNFVLMIVPPDRGGAAAADAALRASGIIARLSTVPNGLRISIGTRSELEAVLSALRGMPRVPG